MLGLVSYCLNVHMCPILRTKKEEMSKIGDLWVRLGLKKDQFSKGIQDAQRETRSFGSVLSSMAKGAQIAWAAVAAAVIKFGRDAIRMTQRWGDEWNNTMNGVKAAYGTFVRQISSGDGWNNLFANMRESYRIAKEVAASLDELFERKTSYNYKEAEVEREIAQLELIRRDTSKSDEERKKAAETIIQKEQELGALKKEIAQQEANDQRRLFRDQTRMNDAEIDFLVKNYNENRDIIAQGRKYLEDRKNAQKAAGQATAASMTSDLDGVAADLVENNVSRANDAVEELDRTTDQAVKDVAAVLQKYNKSSDELVQNLARAEIAVINVDTEVARASARASATLGSLNKASSGSGMVEAPRKGWDDYVEGIQTAARIAAAEAAQIAEAEAEINAEYEHFLEMFKEVKGLTGEAPVAPDFFESFVDQSNKAAEAAAENEQRITTSIEAINTALSEGFSGACQEFMDSLMGLQKFNAGAVLQSLLTPLADLAIKEGEIIIASGIAIKGLKEALTKLNPAVGIAAGAALIAIGAAAKSGLAALAQNGASSTTATTSGYTGGGSWQQDIKTEMTIYVTGKISGNDIEISGERTMNNWSR